MTSTSLLFLQVFLHTSFWCDLNDTHRIESDAFYSMLQHENLLHTEIIQVNKLS